MLNLYNYSKRFAFPLWRWYVSGFFALALTNLITLEVPQLAKELVNAVSAGDIKDQAHLKRIALSIIGLGLLTILIRGISRVLLFWPGRKLEATTKTSLFDRMMHLPQVFYEKFGMGELISRLANDVGQLRAFYAFGVLQIMNLVFLLIFTINKMLSVHVMLTVICLTPIVLMMLIMRPMITRMHKISLANQQATGRLTNRVTEAFVNVHVIQANAASAAFCERADKENFDVFTTNMQSVVLRTVMFPFMGTLMNVSQVATLFYGGYEVMQGRLTVGDILAFNVYIVYLGFPLSSMGIIISLYQRCKACLERLSEIDQAPTEKAIVTVKTPALEVAGASEKIPLIEIKNLNFSYPDVATKNERSTKQRFSLHDINLTVQEGQHIGLFGPIGCGKSTLFNLITRIYDSAPGEIFYGGQDVLSFDPVVLRHNIGYAQQTAQLFSDTILANLIFGIDHTVSEAAIDEASDHSQILSEIKSFELGWQSPIGERGIRLSGGQKQRLALARIFLRKPKLLLLDDVLSSVDHRTEKKLINYIKASKSTLIIASHRISALKHCDEILMLDAGHLIDRGPYEKLAKKHKPFFDEAAEQNDQRA